MSPAPLDFPKYGHGRICTSATLEEPLSQQFSLVCCISSTEIKITISHGEKRPDVKPVSFNGALLSHASSLIDRSQSPQRQYGFDHGNRHVVSGLHRRTAQQYYQTAGNPPAQWLQQLAFEALLQQAANCH
jgi:hypothetical protein